MPTSTQKQKKRTPLPALLILSALLAVYLSHCGGDDSSSTPDYAVTVISVGAGAYGDGHYSPGTKVIIWAGATPAGRVFKNWTATSNDVIFADPNNTTTTFIMPSKAVTLTANFVRTDGTDDDEDEDSTSTATSGGGDNSNTVIHAEYTVTVSGDGTDMTGGGRYKAGDTVTITAGTPQVGYMFKNWTTTSNGVTFANSGRAATTFVMPANAVAVTAVFEAAPTTGPSYKVTVSGAKGATGGGTYTPGMIVNITAGTDTTGQRFKNWTTTSEGVTFINANSTETAFTMPANAVTVTANFDNAATYTVTVSGGTGATGSGRYVSGKVVSITAGTVPAGKRFKNWTTSSSGVTFANANNTSTTFTMPANAVTVTANFESIYTVTVSGGTGGGTYAVGATVSITAGAAPTGQRFKNWTTSSSGVSFANANSASTSFPMPSNAVTVTANFEPNTAYAVTVSSIGYGATGSGDHTAGTTVSVSAGTAPAGYVFGNWTSSTNGVSFANANNATTTFTMPDNAVTVTANFISGFTDDRDGKFYNTVTIGGKKWMAENLNYQPSTGKYWCYGNSAENCAKYGKLYDWNTAKTVCPSGWHLPSRAEWNSLVSSAGGASTAGKKLKAASGWNNSNGTNDYGFSALPGGYRALDENFNAVGDEGYWWTSERTNVKTENCEWYDYVVGIYTAWLVNTCSSTYHWETYYRGMHQSNDNVYVGSGPGDNYQDHGFSVRCVQD
jgi:uncharacterized protein (TIGR02145 family)